MRSRTCMPAAARARAASGPPAGRLEVSRACCLGPQDPLGAEAEQRVSRCCVRRPYEYLCRVRDLEGLCAAGRASREALYHTLPYPGP